MTVFRACVICGVPSPNSHCSKHKPKPWATSRRRDKVKLSGSAEQARRKRVLERFLFCCHVCGKVGTDHTMDADHVVSLGEGGADDELNMAPICRVPCHRNKTAAESIRARGVL